MQQTEEIYLVLMYRKDATEPTVMMESASFADCKARWSELIDQWTVAHQEAKPFVLEKPVVTAFEPGLVGEITIKPKQMMLQNVDDGNPYKQMMMKQGFSQTVPGAGGVSQQQNSSIHPDLLDGGYK